MLEVLHHSRPLCIFNQHQSQSRATVLYSVHKTVSQGIARNNEALIPFDSLLLKQMLKAFNRLIMRI